MKSARAFGGFIQSVGNRIQVVIEQIGINIERHGRRRMPEQPLHRFHIRAGGHRQRRGRVAKLVRYETGESDLSGGTIKARSPEDAIAQHSPATCAGKREIVARTADDMRRLCCIEGCPAGLETLTW
jgi:hypothetical protein